LRAWNRGRKEKRKVPDALPKAAEDLKRGRGKSRGSG